MIKWRHASLLVSRGLILFRTYRRLAITWTSPLFEFAHRIPLERWSMSLVDRRPLASSELSEGRFATKKKRSAVECGDDSPTHGCVQRGASQ